MKKLYKGNNKGFVLVETLIATVFVAAIFSIIYINFFPLMGEYEKRENYDDVDSKYGTYWVKRFVEDSDKFDFKNNSTFQNNGFLYIDRTNFCTNMFNNAEKKTICTNMLNNLKVTKIILTNYYLVNPHNPELGIKSLVKNKDSKTSSFSEELKDYISYLPDYKSYKSLYKFDYRVIVEFERESKDGIGNTGKYKTFSTMEVKK